MGYLSTSKVLFASTASGNSVYYQIGISSGSAVLEKTFNGVTSTSNVTAVTPGRFPYQRPLSGPQQSGSKSDSAMLRTSAGKIAPSANNSGSLYQPFTISIEGTNPGKLQQSANPFSAYNDGISDAVAWGPINMQSATSTTVQLRKVTLV